MSRDQILSVNELKDVLECPVCFELILPPVYQCSRGHLICNNCKGRVSHCPSCRDTVYVRCRALEKVVEKILRPCKYQSYGCETILIADEIVKHEEACQYQQVYCPHAGCDTKVVYNRLEAHIKNCEHRVVRCKWNMCNTELIPKKITEHERNCKSQEVECTVCCNRVAIKCLLSHYDKFHIKNIIMPVKLCPTESSRSEVRFECILHANATLTDWYPTQMQCHGMTFFLEHHVRDNFIYSWIWVVGTESEANYFCFHVVLYKGEHEYCYYGPVFPCTCDSNYIRNSERCLIVSRQVVELLEDSSEMSSRNVIHRRWKIVKKGFSSRS